LVLGEVMMEELRRAFTQKLKLPEERVAVAESVFTSVELISRPNAPSTVVVRDEDDRWIIIATAIAGSADVLVTGDRDLLAVATTAPLPTLAPRAFWELLRRSQSG
jgi:putative PIN family toxin of toxin-antitoxin system